MEDVSVGEIIAHAETEGPQIVTKQGVETVVVVPMAEWKRIKESKYPTLKDWLLAPEPRFDFDPVLRKRKFKLRPPPSLEE